MCISSCVHFDGNEKEEERSISIFIFVYAFFLVLSQQVSESHSYFSSIQYRLSPIIWRIPVFFCCVDCVCVSAFNFSLSFFSTPCLVHRLWVACAFFSNVSKSLRRAHRNIWKWIFLFFCVFILLSATAVCPHTYRTICDEKNKFSFDQTTLPHQACIRVWVLCMLRRRRWWPTHDVDYLYIAFIYGFKRQSQSRQKNQSVRLCIDARSKKKKQQIFWQANGTETLFLFWMPNSW